LTWVESSPASGLRAAHKAEAVRRAIDAAPRDPRLHAGLGAALFEMRRFDEAADALEAALALDRHGFAAWPMLAACMLRSRRAADALDLCDRRWTRDRDASWHYLRGRALEKLRRTDEARAEHLRVVALGDPGLNSVRALLESWARDLDGAALLDFCDAAGERYRDTAAIRAYRALGYSLTGRRDDARALVDLDRAVVRVPFDPPAEFGGIEGFNQALGEAILADPPPSPFLGDADMNYAIRIRDSAPLAALRAFIRKAIADYAARLDTLGLAGVLPPPPENGRLGCGTVVLRREGRNRQHIHTTAWVSTVYHVRVPELPEGDNEHRGALALGVCDEIAPGHRAAWGERYLPPTPGMLTLFPSHFFHDVVPTRSDEPRISVVSDLNPLPADMTAETAAAVQDSAPDRD
jgi:tetratricopeptide (TPR) repeat protein